jgi:hypothetical protein
MRLLVNSGLDFLPIMDLEFISIFGYATPGISFGKRTARHFDILLDEERKPQHYWLIVIGQLVITDYHFLYLS